MIRLGLCCIFAQEPIHFRTTTAAYLARLKNRGGSPYLYLDEIVRSNVEALEQALDYCSLVGIGAFRVNSGFLPLATHPDWKYGVDDLPSGAKWKRRLAGCKKRAEEKGIRLSFHPDQFVVLNSPHRSVVEASIQELTYQAELATLIGADVINIHGGGGYGEKRKSLDRLVAVLSRLPSKILRLLTLENDEKVFTPEDLVPVCKEVGIPLVYDVHHHRCLKDAWGVDEATEQALTTWDREPLFHISSPLEGWRGKGPWRHHDYISVSDVPEIWRTIDSLTIDVEAKAKELAVLKLKHDLQKRGWPI